MGKRFEEHSPTDKRLAVLAHMKATGHCDSFDDVRVLASKPNYNAGKIKEAIEFYKTSPPLNLDQGYELALILLQFLPSSKDVPCRQPRGHLRIGPRNLTNSLQHLPLESHAIQHLHLPLLEPEDGFTKNPEHLSTLNIQDLEVTSFIMNK